MNIRVNRDIVLLRRSVYIRDVYTDVSIYVPVYIKHIHTQNQTRKFEEKNPVTDFLLW